MNEAIKLGREKRCYYFPFCWKSVVGHIERKFVMTQRFWVCQKHADWMMKEHTKESWAGNDWHQQEFVSLKQTNE